MKKRKYIMTPNRIRADVKKMIQSGTLERNKEILEKSESHSLRELSDYYGVSFQRIQAIIDKMIRQRELLERIVS